MKGKQEKQDKTVKQGKRHTGKTEAAKETKKEPQKKLRARRVLHPVKKKRKIVSKPGSISDAVQMRFVYMWPYQNEIVTYARRNNIDPFLVAAVIKNESEFKPGAVSPVGAIGMMQIMPETGEWIAGQMGLSPYSLESLYNPGINIRMGCWYLSELKYEFKDNLLLMMMAYNAGRGNTHGWMNANGWDYTFGETKAIPYPESRNYVASVLHDRDEYYRLYKDKVETK